MKVTYKIKGFAKRNPLALAAGISMAAGFGYAFTAFIGAFYNDVNGIACVGLFGVKDSCVSVFYAELGVFLLNPIVMTMVLFLVFLLVKHIITKYRRKKE